jgi:hypothetical protein
MNDLLTDIFGRPVESKLKKELFDILSKYLDKILYIKEREHAVNSIYEHLYNIIRLSDLMNYENSDE